MEYVNKIILLPVLFIAMLLAGNAVSAKEAERPLPSAEALSKSIGLINNLVHNSSVAKKVRETQVEEALKLVQEAEEMISQAAVLVDKGQIAEAAQARDEALRLMMIAGRVASKSGDDIDTQRRNDYETRLRSVNALRAAQERIAREKSEQRDVNGFAVPVDNLLSQAADHATQSDYTSAMTSLNRAYVLITSAIEAQRGGETLIRSLDFASKEEEFNYELGRYANYLMLVEMLVEQGKISKAEGAGEKFYLNASEEYSDAINLARMRQHERAIGKMEAASKLLVRMIRNAGIFIPGT